MFWAHLRTGNCAQLAANVFFFSTTDKIDMGHGEIFL